MTALLLDLTTLPAPALATLTRQARAAQQSVQERATAVLIEAAAAPAGLVGLTPKQAECWHALVEHHTRTGMCPSFAEIGSAIGLRSKSGVLRLLNGLEERGYIRRLPQRARAIKLVGVRE